MGNWITHVVMTKSRSNKLVLADQKVIQLAAPTIRSTISIAKTNVKPVSALSIEKKKISHC
jgi:hypothetical protein